VQTSSKIIETRQSSSGQKNTLVITGAIINNPMEHTSRWRRPRLPNDTPSQDYSPRLWMVGCNASHRRLESPLSLESSLPLVFTYCTADCEFRKI